MLKIVRYGVLLVALAACSSSSSAPACQIEGSYTATAERTSGDCQLSTTPVTDTITARPADATGPDFALQITGLQGGCALNHVAGDTCKVQGKCDITVSDALDPSNATGTAQYSWTFTGTGFTGTSTVTIPPAKSLPKGCSAIASVTGTRQ
jgi:hypothetical protein